MDRDQLKKQLCEAGLVLIEKELVARTWGNFSVKMDDEYFLITPSGRSYEDLRQEEMVTVKISDYSYEGEIKPSSEKELHARIYRQSKEVQAIVHTHQFWASAVAAAHSPIPVTENEGFFKKEIPCAPYALPTTSALAKAVEKTLAKVNSRAVLLANHGAVCMGQSMAEAVEVAVSLEQKARAYVLSRYGELQGDSPGGEGEMIEFYLQTAGGAG